MLKLSLDDGEAEDDGLNEGDGEAVVTAQ